MERLSGCCAAEAGREKDKKKSKPAAISEVFIMVKNVALLWGAKIALTFNTGSTSGSGACIEIYS